MTLNYIGKDLIKVTSDLRKEPNYGHLCVEGKFRYKDARGRKPVETPLIKQNGQFVPASWTDAISHIVQRLKIFQKVHGPESFAGLATSLCTNEDGYLFQKFLRAALKTPNIDFFGSQSGLDIPFELLPLIFAATDYRIIENAKHILLTSDNPALRYPIIDALVRRAQRKNKADVTIVDNALPAISKEVSTVFLYSKKVFQLDSDQLEKILTMSREGVLHLVPLLFTSNGPGLFDRGVLPSLFPGQKRIDDPRIRKEFESAWGTTLPERPGLSCDKILDGLLTRTIRGIYLMGELPESIEHDHAVKNALAKAEFFIAQSPYRSRLLNTAEVILPPLRMEEVDGTITNIEGRTSSLSVPATMPGRSRPGWKIIAQISTLMGYPMTCENVDEITSGISAALRS